MKPFLLIAWDDYYPAAGTGNWIATFATKEEAESVVIPYQRSKNSTIYTINIKGYDDDHYDDYTIVDLRAWAKDERTDVIKAKLFDEFMQLCTDSSPVDLVKNFGELYQRGLLIPKN